MGTQQDFSEKIAVLKDFCLNTIELHYNRELKTGTDPGKILKSFARQSKDIIGSS